VAIGPTRPDHRWQAKDGHGFAAENFTMFVAGAQYGWRIFSYRAIDG
jgi:hypothetical protein